jgi:hypothetical protein
MRQKFYRFVDKDTKSRLSLNYLLAEKVIVDFKARDIAGIQCRATCPDKFNLDYFCMIYSKHISRYLSSPEKIKTKKL